MEHVPRLSDVLYVGLCRKIGTPTEVAIKRDVMDMEEKIKRPNDLRKKVVMMDSGSSREGFRFRSSDKDIMFWFCNCKLITDFSQCQVYNASQHTLILMEDSDTPPGFVKLRLLSTPLNDTTVPLSCLVPFNSRFYISSSLWRKSYLEFFKNDKYLEQQHITIHGPCTSGFFSDIEFDHVQCFATIHWPRLLKDWVDRCQNHAWPPLSVLKKIIKNGCHCVPIGSKIASTSNELEWRLSFSLAEQQLVSIMNHTQFLCYGLLKIFLKEVINYNKEPILCSYFIKTAMFWIIQIGNFRWCPNNLLDCFWKCFKYLIHCVYRGVFLSFFISKNNMFINKVVGLTRDSLFQQLYQYYRMGVSCLLLSPTLRSILEPALSRPSFVLSSTEGEFLSLAEIDECARTEIFGLPFSFEQLQDYYLILKSIENLSMLSLSPYQSLTLQYSTAESLVCLAFTLANSASCCTHKNTYILDRIICNMLKLAGRLGSVSYFLDLALYYYRTGRYEKTIFVTNPTKQKLWQASNMYITVDRQRYSEIVGNLCLSRRMKIAWINHVRLFDDIPCIEELCLEQNASQQNAVPILYLSPFLMVEMLLVLSHHKLGNRSQCLESLRNLQTLMLGENGTYISLEARDISWQMLGICQHVVGDLHGALQSYQESLRQESHNGIEEATNIRKEILKEQLRRNMQT